VQMGEGFLSYVLAANVEHADVQTDGTPGITFTGNQLANIIEFDGPDPITINAGQGNDTVKHFAPLDAGDTIALSGGEGTDTLQVGLGEGDYGNLNAVEFEVIEIGLQGFAAWAFDVPTTAAFSFSGSGGLDLANVTAESTFHVESFNGDLALFLDDSSGGADTVTVQLSMGSTIDLFVENTETIRLDVLDGSHIVDASSNGVATLVEVTGDGDLQLQLANGQHLALDSFSGTGLSLIDDGVLGAQANTIHLDDSDTTIQLGLGAFSSITLDTSDAGAASDIRLEGWTSSVLLVGGTSELLRLETTFGIGEGFTVNADDFAGELIYTNSGSDAVSYQADESVDNDAWLRLSGAVSETMQFGANFNSLDRVEDSGTGDSDTLNANLTDFGDGELFIEGIETINFSFNVGGETTIDAEFIRSNGTSTIFLSGGEAGRNVTLENLHVNLNASSLSGSVHAFADGERSISMRGSSGADELMAAGSNNETLNGGLGNDTLAGGGSSDQFVFDTTLGATNVDTILDFESASDDIVLDQTIFTTVTGDSNGITAAQFTLGDGEGNVAADDRIVYDAATGALYYDSDGGTSAGRVLFAQLGGGDYGIPLIDAADFAVIA
jgi:hypothetical protein